MIGLLALSIFFDWHCIIFATEVIKMDLQKMFDELIEIRIKHNWSMEKLGEQIGISR